MNYHTALLIGKRQSGKSHFLVSEALRRVHEGQGVALFDPYHEATAQFLARIPKERWCDVILIEPDRDRPVAFNPLYGIDEKDFSKTKDTLKHTLKSVWDYTTFPTPTLDDILSNGIGAILYSNNPSLVSLKWFITNEKRRARVLGQVSDIGVKDFWENDFSRLNDKQQIDETRSTLSKIRAFTGDPFTRNILGQSVSRVDMREVVQDKILVVDLDIRRLGIEASNLLGSLLMAELHQAALSAESDFYCFIDGADRFAQSIQVEMAEMTSSARYMFALTHLGQVGDRFKDALLGASDALCIFDIGLRDSQILQPLFLVGEHDQLNAALHQQSPFDISIRTSDEIERKHIDPIPYPLVPGASKNIRHLSREKYTRQRKDVEDELKRFVGRL